MNNVVIAGIVLLIIGVLLDALTRLSELGFALIVIGVIIAIVGVLLMFTNRGGRVG